MLTIVALALAAALAVDPVVAPAPDGAAYTTDFDLHPGREFVPDGSNPYFTLEPGVTHRYAGVDGAGDAVELTSVVLAETRTIRWRASGRRVVTVARVIEEREFHNGELMEIARAFYARCADTNAIFMFGEEIVRLEDGELTPTAEDWIAGVDGARPGLAMPAQFLLGARYVRHVAPGVSLDLAEQVAMGGRMSTPAGVFVDCVTVLESSAIEADDETLKVYAPGVGLVADGPLQLVESSR